MPHVASDLKSHALNRPLPQAGKQGYTSNSQAKTPFDNVLDETTRPDPAPRKQRAADDSSPRAERTQRAKSTDQPDRTDRTDRTAKSDNKTKTSDAPAPAKADAAVDSVKTDDAGANTNDAKNTDATSGDKTSDQTATADDVSAADAVQPVAETKPAEAAAPVPVAVVIDPAAALAATTAQADITGETKSETAAVAATAAAAATATTPAIADAGQPDVPTAATPAAGDATKATAATPATATTAATAAAGQPDAATADASAEAALAQAQPNALTALAAKAEKTDKADLKSDKKTDTEKKAALAQTALKPTATLDPEAARAAEGEPAKDTGAHARAETVANSHRGITADTATATTAPDTAITPKSADLTPPPGLTVQAPAQVQATGALTATVATAAIVQSDNSEPAVPIAGVAFEITSKALSGRNQFDIRLDPPDLGRIHVRMNVDRDGNVITHMVADRTDTLDLLRKDTAGLERALQDAGLKTSDNSLQFSLRDQQANQQQRNDGDSAHVVVEDEQLAAIEPTQRNYVRYNAPTGGLDIRV